MTRARVALDVDGPIVDFLSGCVEIINRLDERVTTGQIQPHRPDGAVTWDIFDSLGVSDEVRRRTYEAMHVKGFCRNLRAQVGALAGVRAIMEIADVAFVTAPMMSDTWESERRRWLAHHFGAGIRVVSTPDKEWVAADALVDDRVKNLVAWQATHPGGLAVQWIMSTASTDLWPGPSTRDWSHLLQLLEAHCGESRRLDWPSRVWRHT